MKFSATMLVTLLTMGASEVHGTKLALDQTLTQVRPLSEELLQHVGTHHLYLVVVGTKTVLKTDNYHTAQTYLSSHFAAGEQKSRMVVELVDGNLTLDPHALSRGANGCNVFWWNWHDIRKMQSAAIATEF